MTNLEDELARHEAAGLRLTPASAASARPIHQPTTRLEAWLRSWALWVASLVLGLLMVWWANNLNGMFFGEPQVGVHRYGHRLFPVTRWILAGCLLSGVLWMTLSRDALAETGQALAILWIFGCALVLGRVVLFGTPLTEYVYDVRRVEGGQVYLLRGIWGGSDMLYRLFGCDQAELVCTDLTRDMIMRSSSADPVIQIDRQRRMLSVLVEGKSQLEYPLPPSNSP